jgi:hypothetical protein
MEAIKSLFSTIEGNCFGESDSSPLAQIDSNKRQLLYIVIGGLVVLLAVYMFYGDDADNVMESTINSIKTTLGSLLLGGYLSSSGELKTTKVLTEDKIEIDESLLSPF